MEPNDITGAVVDAAMKVHTVLGPGLLESACLLHELEKRGVKAISQAPLPVEYDGITIDIGYRADLLVEDQVIVELKAVDKIHPVHVAQILSYLKLSHNRFGLLINFHELHLKDGIQRFAV